MAHDCTSCPHPEALAQDICIMREDTSVCLVDDGPLKTSNEINEMLGILVDRLEDLTMLTREVQLALSNGNFHNEE